jgi:hypothetical protein
MESIGVKSSILTFYVDIYLSRKEIQMIKICKIVIAVVAMTVLFMGLSGCKKEGPAERAGKKIDETVEKGGQQVEKAGKKIQEDAKGK